jgi:hypothetical protein
MKDMKSIRIYVYDTRVDGRVQKMVDIMEKEMKGKCIPALLHDNIIRYLEQGYKIEIEMTKE